MSTEVVGSKSPSLASDALKPDNSGYGQNGFGGASSDLPGKHTCSYFLPETDLGKALSERKLAQQRPISAEPLPTTFGNHKPKAT